LLFPLTPYGVETNNIICSITFAGDYSPKRERRKKKKKRKERNSKREGKLPTERKKKTSVRQGVSKLTLFSPLIHFRFLLPLYPATVFTGHGVGS
jgi:hypothetical protein